MILPLIRWRLCAGFLSGLVSWLHRKVRYGLALAPSFQWQRDENPYGAPLSILRTELVVMRTWGICTWRAGKLYKARSRLYRSPILQVKTDVKALADIYTPLHRSHGISSGSLISIFFVNCCWPDLAGISPELCVVSKLVKINQHY